ncbi:MAG: RNase adaptor protein RapZ, partial [Deltaproteobacteria bacterium]|nr:RNase adaptor protein RapZ [Deltaproteobacteria bacterium]
LTLGELKVILSSFLELKASREMKLSIVSFGYKYGLPLDADLVMDMRFLPNPNYISGLKGKTGMDKPVINFLIKNPVVKEFFKKYVEIINSLVPLYIKEGKSYLTIAVGCTGGRHRSVFIANHLARALNNRGFKVSEFHRDMRK